MSLLALVVVIALIGLVVGLVQRAPWIDGTFKTLTWWVGVVAAVFAILVAFGVLDLIQSIQVPRVG
jgi:type III secretory pathway component EscS